MLIGPPNNLLIYTIHEDVWHYKILTDDYSCPINMFTCAVNIDNQSILLLGGGQSDKILELTPKNLELKEVGRMTLSRSEHCCVNHRTCVFILGGYNQESGKVLNSCEKYDYGTKQSTLLPPMNHPRCGFSATYINE